MTSDYDTMLLRDNAVPIHIRNLQLLMTEVYKTKWELNPSFMKEICFCFVTFKSTYIFFAKIGVLFRISEFPSQVQTSCSQVYNVSVDYAPGLFFWSIRKNGKSMR